MRIATVGVHVLDTHVIGIASIPDDSDGQLVETIRMSPAGTAGGTAVVLSRLGAEVLSFLRRSVRELGRTIIMVTHDPTAAAYADRVVLLADGRIAGDIADPTPESVLTGLEALRALDQAAL